MKLSIVVPVLNSHEIVRRQQLHFGNMWFDDDVEIIHVDDGSEPPIEYPLLPTIENDNGLENYRIIRTHDKRPWTWALARNAGARIAQGKYLLMTDLDYIIPRETIEAALDFNGDYMGLRREFGVLDEEGKFTQDPAVLIEYGLSPDRIAARGTKIPAHPNNFVIRKDLFFEMGGYREDLIGREYPQGEDNFWKKTRKQWQAAGKLVESEQRPTIYMFPNGRWCGDIDYNPMNLFHNLSRESSKNPSVKGNNL